MNAVSPAADIFFVGYVFLTVPSLFQPDYTDRIARLGCIAVAAVMVNAVGAIFITAAWRAEEITTATNLKFTYAIGMAVYLTYRAVLGHIIKTLHRKRARGKHPGRHPLLR